MLLHGCRDSLTVRELCLFGTVICVLERLFRPRKRPFKLLNLANLVNLRNQFNWLQWSDPALCSGPTPHYGRTMLSWSDPALSHYWRKLKGTALRPLKSQNSQLPDLRCLVYPHFQFVTRLDYAGHIHNAHQPASA